MVRTYLLLALALTGMIAPAKAQQPSFPLPPFLTPRGTPEDQRNCRTDAVKFRLTARSSRRPARACWRNTGGR